VEFLLQAIVGGILTGGIYGLVAAGLSLIFGVMRIINFAHGELLMVAMYSAFAAWSLLGIDPYLWAVISAGILFVGGYAIQRILVQPVLRRELTREPLSVMLVTGGLSMVLQNGFLGIWGGEPRSMVLPYQTSSIDIGDVILSLPRIASCAGAVGAVGILYLILAKTDLGRQMRATSQDRVAAKLMGINEFRLYQLAFGIGAAVVGLAGPLLVAFYTIDPFVGNMFGLKSFVIVVLGGMGSIVGSLIAGVLLGVVEALGAQFMSPTYAYALGFLIMIAVLVVKPTGMLGRERD
jgi:branched-chain amino acid transport system permease protein